MRVILYSPIIVTPIEVNLEMLVLSREENRTT